MFRLSTGRSQLFVLCLKIIMVSIANFEPMHWGWKEVNRMNITVIDYFHPPHRSCRVDMLQPDNCVSAFFNQQHPAFPLP